MKKTLINLGYLVMGLDEKTGVLHLDWNESSGQISEEEYRHSAYSFRDLVLSRPEIKLVLNNLQRFEFTITPILQEFIATEIMGVLFSRGLQKMALVLPEELFSKVSTEQVIEEIVEVSAADLKAQQFDSVTSAEKWLLS